MRYSFHGKVRATGQTVDGYVDAPNASMAIDRLADRGIIGVYSVRPEPKPPKNAVRLDGDNTPEPADEEKPPPRLEAPAAAPAPAARAEAGSEAVFSQLVDKLGTLLVQVEKLLSRPPQQQVIYQTAASGPIRDGHARAKKPAAHEVNGSTLREIFQSNLDLRNSLEKLANSTGAASRMTEAAAKVGDAATRLTQAAVQSQPEELSSQELAPKEPAPEESAAEESAAEESVSVESKQLPETPKPPREPAITRTLLNAAQPAA